MITLIDVKSNLFIRDYIYYLVGVNENLNKKDYKLATNCCYFDKI